MSEPQGVWAVACCGCNRIMGVDGKPLPTTDGFLSFLELNIHTPVGEAASFQTKKSADEFAQKAGWQIADAEGPNHRCPECIADAARAVNREKRRGAYLWIPGGQPA